MRQGAAYQLLSYLGLINDFLVFIMRRMIHVRSSEIELNGVKGMEQETTVLNYR